MDVTLAEERVFILPSAYSMEQAEGRAWAKRIDAFGTVAKLSGFLNRPRDEEFEITYREHRLQPFWRIGCTATYVYERSRDYRVAVERNVTAVSIDGQERPVEGGHFTIGGTEHCRDEIVRDTCFDAVTGVADATLADYLKTLGKPADAKALEKATKQGAVVVPPAAKAPGLVRDVLAGALTRIDADKIVEERLAFQHVDLIYRPVYAFRYRWMGKEAVVEFDGVTGATRSGGDTFEQFLGKTVDAEFLLNAGVEAAGLFIPGARLAEIVITKTIKAAAKR
jgi:hypothetical protein